VPDPATDKIDMLNNMIQEIPQFLHFLNRREMHSAQKSRMWFAPDEIHTEALKKLIEQNLPKVVKEIREKVRQFFFDFEEIELQITAKQIAEYMVNGRYDSYYIIRECKTHFDVENIKNEEGKRVIKTCAYRWKIYSDTGGMADGFTVRTEKQVGQPLVFKREDFLTEYEIQALRPAKQETDETEEAEIPFSDDEVLPF
jgi:hypothetical protein